LFSFDSAKVSIYAAEGNAWIVIETPKK